MYEKLNDNIRCNLYITELVVNDMCIHVVSIYCISELMRITRYIVDMMYDMIAMIVHLNKQCSDNIHKCACSILHI